MAKMTLLAMTQDILNDMSSDSVNSISDTIESLQVAQHIKTVYFDLVEELGIVGNGAISQLVAFGDTSNPTKLQMPATLRELSWIKYNKKLTAADADLYSDVTYLTPEDFMKVTNQLSSTDANVLKTTGQGADILIRTDKAPTYWTTFDDDTIIMDSYDSSIENSLQASKTQIFGIFEYGWTQSDTFVPSLPANVFPLFLSRAKLVCNNKIKSMDDPLEMRKEHKLKIRYQTTKRRSKETRNWQGPDYGRH